MKLFKSGAHSVPVIIGVWIISVVSASASGGIVVSLDQPVPPQIWVNNSATIDITISNPDNIPVKSWTMDLSFDPDVVDVTGFLVGGYIPGVVPQANLDFENDGVAPDIARLGALNFSGTTGSDASGLLGQVTLLGIGEGQNSPLTITGDLLDAAGSSIGEITFTGTEITVETPEPMTICIIAMGGLTLITKRPRFRRPAA